MRKLVGLLLVVFISCQQEDEAVSRADINYRQEMRDFVIGISQYAKEQHPGLIIIPQNGIELVTNNGEEDGTPNTAYLSAIDGNGQEDLFYGYEDDDKATPPEDNDYLKEFLDISKNAGNVILVTDYCATPAHMNTSYNKNHASNYVSFAADYRELNNIPVYPNPVYAENDAEIHALAEVKNFLYLINPENFNTKSDFISAITATNYDLLIMDLFFQDGTAFTAAEID